MAEIAQDAQQEFWRSPTVIESAVEATPPAASGVMAETCTDCGGEFMIGARFCHTCGRRRPAVAANNTDAAAVASLWAGNVALLRSWAVSLGAALSKISLPDWVEYLHFHKIKRWIGLPTAAMIAFLIGLGCVAGAIGVSLYYKASNLAEFQAIQMWRIEWLLAATASFVAGILLKKPSDIDRD
jgi:hypothetical protein